MANKNGVPFEKTALGHLMQEEVLRLGYSLLSTNRWLDGERALGVYLKALKLRLPTEDRSDCLVIVTAVKDGMRLVGFHSADTPAEAVKGAVARVENGTMVWRHDNSEVQQLDS